MFSSKSSIPEGYSIFPEIPGYLAGMIHTQSALHFTKLDFSRAIPQFLFCLTVSLDMSWTLSFCRVKFTPGSLVSSIPDRLESVAAVLPLLSQLNQCQICERNADENLSQARFVTGSVKSDHFAQISEIEILLPA